jgi:hypothetical protein
MQPFPTLLTCLDPQGDGALAEAYAAGALDAVERTRFEAHLRRCPACRRALAEDERLLAAMSHALATASPRRPPPDLRPRILAAAKAEPAAAKAEPAAAKAEPAAARLAGSASAGAPPRSSVERIPPSPQPRRPRTWLLPKGWWRPRAGVALAAITLVALVGGWTVQFGVALARERALRAEYAAMLNQQVTQQEMVLEVVDHRLTVRRQLAPPPGSPAYAPGTAPYGKLYTRPDLREVVAMAARLPQPPAGQAYHLWLKEGAQSRLGGTLAFNQGFGILVFEADRQGPVYDAAWITLQPPGTTTPAATLLIWQAG